MRSNSSRVHNNHTTFNLILVDTTEQQSYVITSFTFWQSLAEHFNTGNNRLLILSKTEQLNFVTDLTFTSFDTTCSNSTTPRN